MQERQQAGSPVSLTRSAAGFVDASVIDAGEIAKTLGADLEKGLSAGEASRRLAEAGPNELRSVPQASVWRRVLSHFQDPLVYLLLAAIAIALIAWLIDGRVGWPVDAIVIAIVVLLNGILGYAQEARARDAVAALARMTAVSAAVLREGKSLRVPSVELAWCCGTANCASWVLARGVDEMRVVDQTTPVCSEQPAQRRRGDMRRARTPCAVLHRRVAIDHRTVL